jgi:hypothetical protein
MTQLSFATLDHRNKKKQTVNIAFDTHHLTANPVGGGLTRLLSINALRAGQEQRSRRVEAGGYTQADRRSCQLECSRNSFR